MRKFLSVWLVWIVLLVFAAAILFTFPTLTRLTEEGAEGDLNVLLNAAFTRLSGARADEEAVSASSNSNILAKARAIDRFVSHDDTLMQVDALATLGELLTLNCIDVTDAEGTVVASSIAGRIGLNLAEDTAFSWMQPVREGDDAACTHVDTENKALLAGCVSRTDTDGIVLVQSLDVPVLNATAAAEPEQVLREMSFIRDTIAVAEAGEDETYIENNRMNVRRTQDEVTLVASRTLPQVHLLRNAVLLCEAVGMVICLVCAAVVQGMLLKRRREAQAKRDDERLLYAPLSYEADGPDAYAELEDPLSVGQAYEADAEEAFFRRDDDESAAVYPAEPAAYEAAPAEANEGELASERVEEDANIDEPRSKRKKRKKPRKPLFEFVDLDEPEEAEADVSDRDAAADEPLAEMQAEADADEAALEEPPAPKKRRKSRKKAAQEAAEAAEAFAAPEPTEEACAEEAFPVAEAEAVQPDADAFTDDGVAAPEPAPAPKRPRTRRGKRAAEASEDGFDKVF